MKKSNGKFLVFCLSVLMALLFIAGCSGSTQSTEATEEQSSNDKEITLRYAHNHNTGEQPNLIKGIIEQFEEDYPNVTIKEEITPSYDHQTKIQMDATSNRMPDVFDYWRLDPAYGLDKMAKAGLVADLTEFTSDFRDLFPDSAWETASQDGNVYGIPLNIFYIHFLANEEVFSQAGLEIPETWEELIGSMDPLKEAGFIPWGSSIKDDHGVRLFDVVFSRQLTNERALNMFAGNEPINVPEVVTAARHLEELVVGNLPEDSNAVENDSIYAKYVNTGKAALVVDGSFRVQSVDEETAKNMKVIEFPLIPGGEETEKAVEQDLTQLVYASAKSWEDKEKRPYIKEFMKRLTSKEAGKNLAEIAHLPVPTQGIEIDEEKLGPLATKGQNLANSRPADRWIPKVMDPEKRKVWEPLLSEFLNGQYTPEEFVEKMHEIFYEG